jgi:integrase
VGSAGAARRAPGWDVSQGRRPGAGPTVPLRGAALTVAQLQTFLQRARTDRFFALWVLEATSGMRRCELAGARRDLLDLAAGTLEIDVTRVVVDGQVIESDGKTENAQHLLALDPFTLAALKAHVEMLDRERKDHGPDYRDHGVLFCWETARRILTPSRDGSNSWSRRPVSLRSTCTTCGTPTPRPHK